MAAAVHEPLFPDFGSSLHGLAVLDRFVTEMVFVVIIAVVMMVLWILFDYLLLTTGNENTDKNEQSHEHSFQTSAFCNK